MERLSKSVVAAWRSLDEASVRKEQGLIRLEGPHLVEEGARAGLLTEILAIGPAIAGAWSMRLPDVRVTEVTESELARVVEQKTPTGVAAIARRPRSGDLSMFARLTAPILVLEAVQDPGNVGTLARTAAALGVGLLVTTPGTADPMGVRALRASAGALLRIPHVEGTLSEVLNASRAATRLVIVPDVREGEDYRRLNPGRRWVLLASNEGGGTQVPKGEVGTRRVTIPLQAEIESLNVGAAIAILLAAWR